MDGTNHNVHAPQQSSRQIQTTVVMNIDLDAMQYPDAWPQERK
jgi:hypothetical protein